MPDWKFTPELIAPCGMNCGACIAFFGYTIAGKRRKHACGNCQSRKKPCAFVAQHCDRLTHKSIQFCFECPKFPCKKLQTLDDRYRKNYAMSLIENLRYIQANGIQKFIEEEQLKRRCPECGGTVCIHNKKCYNWNQTEKKEASGTKPLK